MTVIILPNKQEPERCPHCGKVLSGDESIWPSLVIFFGAGPLAIFLLISIGDWISGKPLIRALLDNLAPLWRALQNIW